MAIITLLSDFGLRDTYVGQMKGVMAAIAPQASLIDLTHLIPPQNVLAGALALDAAVDAFPDGAVHLAVVDPGVGTDRQAVALRTQSFAMVGPDNGLFDLVLKRHLAVACVRLDPPAGVSDTFHGRDVFAPAAARLAAGVALEELGEPTQLHVRLEAPEPRELEDALEVHVLDVDHFGNLVTDARRPVVEQWCRGRLDDVEVTLGHTTLRGIHRTFADVGPGEALAYFGSSGRLEVAVRNGSAAGKLGLAQGSKLVLRRS